MKIQFKRAISLLIAIAVLALANVPGVEVQAKVTFKDVKTTDWHYNYVTKLINLDITSGYPDGTYRPNNTVTRAEFVTFLCKTLGHEQAQGDPFIDTQKHWATGYITIALANGIFDLPADKLFRPNEAITRLEAAEMTCRAFNLPKDTKTTAFADVAKTENGYTNTVYNEYLMVGSIKDGKRYFYPGSDLKRSEVAAVVVNIADYKVDRIVYLNKKIEELKEVNAELSRYAEWENSVKNISVELLNNTSDLYCSTYYESNKVLYEDNTYLENWGKKYKLDRYQMADEMVRVGTKFMNAFANINYKDLDSFTAVNVELKSGYDLNNYLPEWYEEIESNSIVRQGSFITSEGMLVENSRGNLLLRGTLRYKYLSPTKSTLLNSEIVSDTGKPSLLNTWYEQDIEINFAPRNARLMVESFRAISDVRIAK